MKKNLLLIMMLCSYVFGFAQKDYKLVEQSPKDKPSWLVKGKPAGTLMVQANKVSTLEEAQDMVLTSLLNDIASSVAVQVTGEIVNDVDWTTVGDKEVYIQKVKNNTTTKIAKMPALQGVSLSKAEVYWERYTNKKTKETCYDYYILYPFSDFELQELIDQYNAQEKALNDKIDKFRDDLVNISDIGIMLQNITDMKAMIKELADDDVKINKLKNNVSIYEKAIDEIYIDVLDNTSGKLVIRLMYDEKVMKTKTLPQLKSECARDFTKKHDGDEIILTFNTFDCYEQDDNYVEVRFTFGKKKIVKKINIKL